MRPLGSLQRRPSASLWYLTPQGRENVLPGCRSAFLAAFSASLQKRGIVGEAVRQALTSSCISSGVRPSLSAPKATSALGPPP